MTLSKHSSVKYLSQMLWSLSHLFTLCKPADIPVNLGNTLDSLNIQYFKGKQVANTLFCEVKHFFFSRYGGRGKIIYLACDYILHSVSIGFLAMRPLKSYTRWSNEGKTESCKIEKAAGQTVCIKWILNFMVFNRNLMTLA